jgi:hypothetical protein
VNRDNLRLLSGKYSGAKIVPIDARNTIFAHLTGESFGDRDICWLIKIKDGSE